MLFTEELHRHSLVGLAVEQEHHYIVALESREYLPERFASILMILIPVARSLVPLMRSSTARRRQPLQYKGARDPEKRPGQVPIAEVPTNRDDPLPLLSPGQGTRRRARYGFVDIPDLKVGKVQEEINQSWRNCGKSRGRSPLPRANQRAPPTRLILPHSVGRMLLPRKVDEVPQHCQPNMRSAAAPAGRQLDSEDSSTDTCPGMLSRPLGKVHIMLLSYEVLSLSSVLSQLWNPGSFITENSN